MPDNSTINYYDKNALDYFNKTCKIDMSANCERFCRYVKPGGCIIDIGAGSGRDLRYFKAHGYDVEGIDAFKELCQVASAYADAQVINISVSEWVPSHRYDGVWANASILHLPQTEIAGFFKKLPVILNPSGAAYISMKTGIDSGYDIYGRYFTGITEQELREFVTAENELKITEIWYSADALQRDDVSWINIIVQNNIQH